jgi:hypothetical protein
MDLKWNISQPPSHYFKATLYFNVDVAIAKSFDFAPP